MRDGDCRTFLTWIAQVPSSLEPSHTVGFHTDIDSNPTFISVHAGHHVDGHARQRTRTAPTIDACPKLGAVLLMRRTSASDTQIERAQLRRVRMEKSQRKGVYLMMLETILALLGLATCGLVLVSFWGSDLFGSRTRKRS